jgi:hypothetical protein
VWLVVVEFAGIAGLFVADFERRIFFSKLGWLFLMAWISLRLRGLGWRDVGLGAPRRLTASYCHRNSRRYRYGTDGAVHYQPLLEKLFDKMPLSESPDESGGGIVPQS